jgi:hypothetical protein
MVFQDALIVVFEVIFIGPRKSMKKSKLKAGGWANGEQIKGEG